MYHQLSNYQLRLYCDLYKVHEALVQLQHIEKKFAFLRGSTAEAQQLLLANQLGLQERLRDNKRAIQAAAT